MIVKSSELPKVEKDINTTVCWWIVKVVPGAKYFVQHNTNRVLAKIDSVKMWFNWFFRNYRSISISN
jgi:sulfate adenylyltransferase subunit 1